MREETKKRKEKKEKIKQQVNTFKKDSGISKKLTKQEENQALLSAMKKVKETETEIDQSSMKLETRRTYICSCGCQVTLEGETYKRKVKDGFELCSTCSK